MTPILHPTPQHSPPCDTIWANCFPCVDFTECADWMTSDWLLMVRWTLLFFSPQSCWRTGWAALVPRAAAGREAGVVLSGHMMYSLPCPAWVWDAKEVLDPLVVVYFGILDALPQVRLGCTVIIQFLASNQWAVAADAADVLHGIKAAKKSIAE